MSTELETNADQNVIAYGEACLRFRNILDNMSKGSASRKLQRRWDRDRLKSYAEHGVNSLYTLLPTETDRGFGNLTFVIHKLADLGINTRRDLLRSRKEDIVRVTGVGKLSKTIGERRFRVVAAIHDIARAESRLVRADLREQLLSLNPELEKAHRIKEDASTQSFVLVGEPYVPKVDDADREAPSKAGYSTPETIDEEKDKPLDLKVDKWTPKHLLQYQIEVLNDIEPLSSDEYPKVIEPYPAMHSVMDKLRKLVVEDGSRFVVEARSADLIKGKYLWQGIRDKHEEYSRADIAELTRGLLGEKGYEHVIGEIFVKLPGFLSSLVGRDLGLPGDEHTYFPMQQLYRFLSYEGKLRPLYTALVCRDDDLIAFRTSDMKPVEDKDSVSGLWDFEKENRFSSIDYNVEPGPRGRRIRGQTDNNVMANYMVMRNHRLVIYREEPGGNFVKLEPLTITDREPFLGVF